MKVFATKLGSVLSITFVDDGRGWHFGSWTNVSERPLAVQPTVADRDRRFTDVSEALAYFRSHYAHVAGSDPPHESRKPAT